MRIVLDTNVIVSGLISAGGPPGRLLDAWLDHRFDLVTSAAQLEELARVLRYERIATRLPADRVSMLMRNMCVAEIVEPVEGVELSPDLDDNVILATAFAGKATMIVSGDKGHMLSLGDAAGIPILLAREALDLLGEGGVASPIVDK